MEYKKLNKLQKWYLKYTDYAAYKQYKRSLQDYDFYKRTTGLIHPPLNHLYKQLTVFKHSGNSGDIIYSLPTILELSKKGKAHFYLEADQYAEYKDYHPLGAVKLNTKMIEMLKPLLQHQPALVVVEKYNGEPVDYDLDEFRKYSFSFDNSNIIHWYFYVYAIFYNTSLPWLIAPKDEYYKDCIVLARSHRYRSPMIDYSFLKKYPNKIFLGVEEEYEDMKKVLPDLIFKPVKDFLEMATVINSCKLLIGNQSFPFSLAEALKANRLLEVYYKAPNVIVEGKGGGSFIYQLQFEYAVRQRLG